MRNSKGTGFNGDRFLFSPEERESEKMDLINLLNESFSEGQKTGEFFCDIDCDRKAEEILEKIEGNGYRNLEAFVDFLDGFKISLVVAPEGYISDNAEEAKRRLTEVLAKYLKRFEN